MNNEDLLTKWLNDDISKEELELLKSSSEYAAFIRISEAAAKLSPPEFKTESQYISLKSSLSPHRSITNRPKRGRLRSMKTFLRIAAVIAILFAGYHLIDSRDTTINTSIAEKQSVTLPDHSEVILNSKSEIVFNKNNWIDERSLSLQGEAYFKVAKGKTFKVESELGNVTVLGTQFNVYVRDDHFYINCYEGLVNVSFNETNIDLIAGKELKIESGVIVHHDFSNTKNPGWVSDESYFENTTLAIVLKEIERQYPIKITTDNISVDKHFTGAFTHKDLELALKSICEPLDLAYSINGKDDVTLYAKGNK